TYTQPFGRWPYCLGLYATRVQITSTSLPPDGSPVVEHLVNRLQISLRACLDHIRRSAPARVQVAVVFNPDGHLAERVLSARDGLQGIAFQIHRKARHPVDGMVHGVDRAFTARGLLHDLLPAPDAYRSRRERAVTGDHLQRLQCVIFGDLRDALLQYGEQVLFRYALFPVG